MFLNTAVGVGWLWGVVGCGGDKHMYTLVTNLIYTEFIIDRLYRKLLAYTNTLKSIPGTN